MYFLLSSASQFLSGVCLEQVYAVLTSETRSPCPRSPRILHVPFSDSGTDGRVSNTENTVLTVCFVTLVYNTNLP